MDLYVQDHSVKEGCCLSASSVTSRRVSSLLPDIFSTSIVSIDRRGRVQINDDRCSKAHPRVLSVMVSALGLVGG